MKDDSGARPFFIVGAGRSGTTLLRLILSGHSRLFVCPETWFVEDLVARLPLEGKLSPAQLEEAVRIVAFHYRWPDLKLREADLRAELSRAQAPSLRNFLDALYALVGRNAGKMRVGDKTPVYVRILPQLKALYPDAQFIHLLRDGRDVALSYIDAGWKQRCYEGARFEWTAAVRAARRFGARAAPGHWLEVRYEELVADPEHVVRGICAFLGEAFEPAMLDTCRQADLVPERERGIHLHVRDRIAPDRAGAWQSRLAALEVFVMEACLGVDLRRCGYDLVFSSPAWRPVLSVSRAMLIAAGPVLMHAVPALQRRGLPRMVL